ncbi:DUF58 domain-containing protein [Anaerocolumna sp. AGMB13025]|uniref:DUF58 domain-containing protein n=1 Tax=Anaerocolumna sp. AGMB13025 TaxID=3039116 RepID=UPI00241C1A41|nr:DUF58 domain-containing protein [Anaerocolumna sp. AGMB13025]WFR56188.1 DUF58 domain-containing protein [Anaerocolumna sp. AGMB13025]
MILLSAMLGALLLYLLQNYFYHKYWNKNLSVKLSFSEEAAVEGEEVILYETLMNKKLLPLPILKVKFMTSKYLAFQDMNNSNITDNFYRNDLISIMMYQKLTRSLTFLCSHRGYYSIQNADVVCSDLFLTFEKVANYDMNLNLYVYPGPVELTKFETPFKKMLGTVLTRRFMNEDPFEFRSIREYQPYDNIKSVNWKASAKTGSLKVNVNDYTSSQQVKLFINLEADSIWKHEDLEEESIRIAAAFAFAFIKQGIPTSIHTNTRDIITGDLLTIPAGSGASHIKTIQEALSRIDTTKAFPSFVATLGEEFQTSGSSDYIILISFYQKADLQELLLPFIENRTDFSWIIPTNREVTITTGDGFEPYIIPWEVKAFSS